MSRTLLVIFLLMLVVGGVVIIRGSGTPAFASVQPVDSETEKQACELIETVYQFVRQNRDQEVYPMLVKLEQADWEQIQSRIKGMPALKFSSAEVTMPNLSPDYLVLRIKGRDGCRYFFMIKKNKENQMLLESCGKVLP